MDKNKEMIGLQKKPYPISTKEFAGFPVISDKKQIKIKHLIHLTQNVHSLITYYRKQFSPFSYNLQNCGFHFLYQTRQSILLF